VLLLASPLHGQSVAPWIQGAFLMALCSLQRRERGRCGTSVGREAGVQPPPRKGGSPP
jgi:hypothetical protein